MPKFSFNVDAALLVVALLDAAHWCQWISWPYPCRRCEPRYKSRLVPLRPHLYTQRPHSPLPLLDIRTTCARISSMAFTSLVATTSSRWILTVKTVSGRIALSAAGTPTSAGATPPTAFVKWIYPFAALPIPTPPFARSARSIYADSPPVPRSPLPATSLALPIHFLSLNSKSNALFRTISSAA